MGLNFGIRIYYMHTCKIRSGSLFATAGQKGATGIGAGVDVDGFGTGAARCRRSVGVLGSHLGLAAAAAAFARSLIGHLENTTLYI